METRRSDQRPQAAKSSPLPGDYLNMVREVFTANFDAGLQALAKINPAPRFGADGAVYSNEVVLRVSLLHEGQLAATSAYASCDFDPKASSPTIQDLLAACVDALGSVFGQLLDPSSPERIEQLAKHSLSAFEEIPFKWTPVEVERQRVYVKVDKSNPELDQMADDWLEKHDPDFREREAREQKEIEKLFVTGPKRGKPGEGGSSEGGSVH